MKARQILLDRVKEIDERIEKRAIFFTSLTKGILISDNGKSTPQSEQIKLITGGDEMKFRGITIHKNKTCNTWYTRYTINGKQIYISSKTQQDCYNKLKVALKKQEQKQLKMLKEPKQKEQKSMTFIEWYKKWLELYKQNVKIGTKKDYEVCILHLQQIKDKPLNQITSIMIMQELNKISGNRTKQKVYEFANAVFDKATKNEIITKNPMLIIDKPKHKRVNGLALTNEDELKYENEFIKNNLDCFLICLYQGLRKGEMLALTGKDIDIKNKRLTINKSLNKSNKIDTTKNIYSNRVIPIFEKSIEILKKYVNIEGRIFNYTQRQCEKEFLKIKSIIGGNYTIHCLRHTFITRCQEKNISLHFIQKWVGHNIGSKITNTVYTHTRELAELENIEKMDN